jgi:hypothetical protein
VEAHRSPIDDIFGAERWGSMHLRAKAELGKSIRARDS